MQDYRNLVVWQKSHQLVLSTYKATRSFPKEERYHLTQQLRRAATSIPTNIAEGCGKSTARNLASFLEISLGSTQEIEYLTFLSRELQYFDDPTYTLLTKHIGEIKAMLIAFIKRVRSS